MRIPTPTMSRANKATQGAVLIVYGYGGRHCAISSIGVWGIILGIRGYLICRGERDDVNLYVDVLHGLLR